MSAALTRRGLVGRAVAAAAGATLAGVSSAQASPAGFVGDPDPVLALIAEEARVRKIAVRYTSRADTLLFALRASDPRRRDEAAQLRDTGPMGELYRAAERHTIHADEIYDKIEETRATTIAGVIAQLELGVPDALGEIAIEGLRAIQAREGRA